MRMRIVKESVTGSVYWLLKFLLPYFLNSYGTGIQYFPFSIISAKRSPFRHFIYLDVRV